MDRSSPWQRVDATAAALVDRLGEHDVAVVLGSGWAGAADSLGELVAQVDVGDLPAAVATTVPGHPGLVRSVAAPGGRRVLVAVGRPHLYEGHDAAAVVHLCRAAVRAGVGSVILTNAAGSLDASAPIGSAVLISDQLNLTGSNPMVGEAPPGRGATRFVDLSDLYDRHWRERVRTECPGLTEGVYAGVLGGSFETPAEIRAMGALGADLVGMSTVLESIAAHHLGARVLGVSLVTNLAAGLQPTVDHLEVLDAGRAASERLVEVLTAAIAAAPTAATTPDSAGPPQG